MEIPRTEKEIEIFWIEYNKLSIREKMIILPKLLAVFENPTED